MSIVSKKIILFIAGFCGYITLETLFRGYSYAVMGILGGLLLIILDSLNNFWTFDLDILVQGIYGSIIITTIELLLGEFIKVTELLPVMWDYSKLNCNYDGVICLRFSLLWILLSICGVMIADAINYYLLGDDEQPYYKIFGKEFLRFKKK